MNHLDEPVLIAVSKPLLTEFGIYHRFESCEVTKQPNVKELTKYNYITEKSHRLGVTAHLN